MFRATQIVRYLQAAAEHGIGDRQLLAGTRLDAAEIRPDSLVSLEQYQTVVRNLLELTGDAGFAFIVGHSFKLSEFGLVGYAMLSARTLREATEVWVKYSNSLVGQYSQTSWRRVAGGHEVSFFSADNTSALHRFETEESIVRGINVVRDLTAAAPVFHSIALSYPEPPHRARYEEVLGCPLQFDAPRTVVRIASPDIDTPVKTTAPELFDICAEHCLKVMNLLPDASLMLTQLRQLFLSRPGRLPDLEEAAAALGVSVSSLRRKLEGGGKSYQAAKDEFRLDLAREYLRSGHMSPKQVAYLLGFTSPSNFSRAFKAWSGETAGQFLRAAKAG